LLGLIVVVTRATRAWHAGVKIYYLRSERGFSTDWSGCYTSKLLQTKLVLGLCHVAECSSVTPMSNNVVEASTRWTIIMSCL